MLINMPSSESLESSLPETSEKNPISVSKIEVMANPDGVKDPWNDEEELAQEGADLLANGVVNLEKLYFPES